MEDQKKPRKEGERPPYRWDEDLEEAAEEVRKILEEEEKDKENNGET
jgi:hypothetical protein